MSRGTLCYSPTLGKWFQGISIPDRIVSIFDPEARPIKKGKLGKKVEFGYNLQIEESENGFIMGYDTYIGNPSDEVLLLHAVERHIKLFGKVPRSIAADRGYGTKANEEALTELNVKKYLNTTSK